MIIDQPMREDRSWVCITTDEYRELVRAKRDAECLKQAIREKSLSYSEVDLLCKMFLPDNESGEAE